MPSLIQRQSDVGHFGGRSAPQARDARGGILGYGGASRPMPLRFGEKVPCSAWPSVRGGHGQAVAMPALRSGWGEQSSARRRLELANHTDAPPAERSHTCAIGVTLAPRVSTPPTGKGLPVPPGALRAKRLWVPNLSGIARPARRAPRPAGHTRRLAAFSPRHFAIEAKVTALVSSPGHPRIPH